MTDTEDRPVRKTKTYARREGARGGHVRPYVGEKFICGNEYSKKGQGVLIKLGCQRMSIHSGTCAYGCGKMEKA